ncbi:MAG: SDR family NAD(P)-dependent oxidoreductase [Candidatus Nanopelagicales bacterium]
MFDFSGRRILITGCGSERGIGFVTAKALMSLSAKVFITSTTERIFERANDLHISEQQATVSDLTQEDEVISLIEKVKTELGGLDVLINNAGMTSIHKPAGSTFEVGSLETLSVQGFEESIRRNLFTAFLVSKYALPELRKGNHPRIAFVSSVTGSLMAMKNDVGYATAKAGLLGMMRSIALDEARYGISCNSVSPGWIKTESQLPHEAKEGFATPLGRSADPEEVASMLIYLASREASYITGQNIVIDGANSIQEERTLG